MKKLTKYALLLAAMVMGFAFTSCQQDSGDDTPAVKYYTVAFNSMGGTEVKSQKVESGKRPQSRLTLQSRRLQQRLLPLTTGTLPQMAVQHFQKQHLILTQQLKPTLHFMQSGRRLIILS